MPILLYANATCFREHLKKKSFCTMAVYSFFIHILRKYIYVQPLITLSQKKNTTVNYIIMPSKRKVIWEIWMLNQS